MSGDREWRADARARLCLSAIVDSRRGAMMRRRAGAPGLFHSSRRRWTDGDGASSAEHHITAREHDDRAVARIGGHASAEIDCKRPRRHSPRGGEQEPSSRASKLAGLQCMHPVEVLAAVAHHIMSYVNLSNQPWYRLVRLLRGAWLLDLRGGAARMPACSSAPLLLVYHSFPGVSSVGRNVPCCFWLLLVAGQPPSERGRERPSVKSRRWPRGSLF
jgi:hypothetical protein